MPDNPYLQWPVFRRSVVAAFQRSLNIKKPSVRLGQCVGYRVDLTIRKLYKVKLGTLRNGDPVDIH